MSVSATPHPASNKAYGQIRLLDCRSDTQFAQILIDWKLIPLAPARFPVESETQHTLCVSLGYFHGIHVDIEDLLLVPLRGRHPDHSTAFGKTEM